ncbi:MAG: flagellar export protein FliJ [Armatimonadetes bacterium]|nr:flagellar export protein FliJ [Armatimonadota bacterium]
MAQKKFKFKLQSILELKQKKEDEEKERLGKLFSKLNQAKIELENLKNKEIQAKTELKSKQISGGMDVEELKRYHYHINKLNNAVINQKIKIKEINIEIDKQREILLICAKEKKTYEKLKEKYHQKFIEELDEEERKFIDELATMRYFRTSKKDE